MTVTQKRQILGSMNILPTDAKQCVANRKSHFSNLLKLPGGRDTILHWQVPMLIIDKNEKTKCAYSCKTVTRRPYKCIAN